MTNLTLYTTDTAPIADVRFRTITAAFRQPARYVHVCIPYTDIDSSLMDVPIAYKAIVENAILTAAKDILSDFVKGYSVGVMPIEIDDGYFALNALIDRASNAGIQWLDKETITKLWNESYTYGAWLADPRMKTTLGFRKAVTYMSELVIKLAGKTSVFKAGELDTILAKLNEADYSTTLGQFITRRIAAMQSKPVDDTVNVDLL